ncbi:phosphoribosylanthranilate isomerase [Bacillus spongiae]|uniref:N-(5'-phosphoribosyl)anthranilate isomerase n=1 Tax=Bacillus spongiae TaxID=2683610 RepID=A0ABU8HHQ1_9BACI
MTVKICGITSPIDAQNAIEAGADMIGFVFAKSRRKVSVKEAENIVKTLDHNVKTVGVFVDAPLDEVLETARTVGLDMIQLHGKENAEYIKQIPYPIIKAISVTETTDLGEIQQYDSDYLLFDGAKAGSGETFEWDLLETFKRNQQKVMLAGGLTSENVAEAIMRVKPEMVDVSSGVEVNGKKNQDKMKAFVKEAQKAFAKLKDKENQNEQLRTAN